ncbi:MAG: hypothetical protein OSB43_18755, partial [Nocardioides sp.]|uniref:hypothetical protein n=1 Tax=Nocardioides sp. TaxID=35761 RepID=UPI00238359F8
MKITLAVRIALAGLGLSLLAGGPALAAPAQHAVETTTDRVPAVSARVAAVSSPGVVAPRRAAKGGRATVRYLGNRFVGRVRAPGACDSKRTVVARVGPRRLGKARSNRRGRFVVGTAPTHGLVTVIVRKRAGCRPIKRTTRIDAPSLSSKDTTSGVAGVLAAAPASCMRRRSVSVTLDGAPAGSASTTRTGTYAFSTTTPGRYRAAASSTRRCEGVTSTVAVKRTPVAESVVDRVEVVAEPLFFTAPGQSSSVGVAAFDAAGEPVPVAPGDVSWASSDPGVVSAAAGVVRSRAANGSAEIVAMVDGVESEPVIAVVTPVTEETTLLDDPAIDVDSAELVPVADLETDADGLPDISIVLTLPTAPVVGEILLAVGDIPLGGRVVSAQSLGLGRYRVVLAPVGVEEALPDLTIDESVDLSGDLGPTPEDNPEVFEETIDPSAAEPAAGPAGASRGTPRTAASRAPAAAGPTPGPFTGEPRVVYDKPPVKCELEGTGVNAPPFQLTMDKPLKLNIEPELDVDFRNGELQRLAVDVSGSLAVQASVKFTAQADVKLQCKAQAGKTIVGFLKKIPGLRSLISGNIDFGKGFSFEIKALGPGITATAGASFVFNDASWGFERDPETDQVVVIDDSDEDLIKELKPITTFSPTNVADSSFNFRLSPVAADVFAYADFKAAPGALSGPIGDRIFDNSKGDDKTTIAGGKIGSRLQASLDDLGDELADPTFRSTYEWLAGAQFKVGVTKTIRTLIRMFGVRELSLFELKAMPEIFVSPRDATLAVAGIDRHPDSLTHPDFSEDRVFADDVVHLRGRIEEGIFWQNIIVTPPVPPFNIDEVRLVTLGADGDVDTLVEQEVDFT